MTDVVKIDSKLYHELLAQAYLLNVAETHLGQPITQLYPAEADNATEYAKGVATTKEPKWFKLY